MGLKAAAIAVSLAGLGLMAAPAAMAAGRHSCRPGGRARSPHAEACTRPASPTIQAAIAAALRERDCPAAAARAAAMPQAAFGVPAMAAADGGPFVVTTIRRDRVQHRTLFRIAIRNAVADGRGQASRARRPLPFWVSLPGDVPARAVRPPRRAGAPETRREARLAGPLLVRPHRPALLTVLSPGMRIAMVVIPLQQGRRGQLVRAEDPANHRFLTGTVTGKNQLEARL